MGGRGDKCPPIFLFVCYLEVRAQKEGARFGFFSLLWVEVRFCESPPQYFPGNYAPVGGERIINYTLNRKKCKNGQKLCLNEEAYLVIL